jgi:hypothetical protein
VGSGSGSGFGVGVSGPSFFCAMFDHSLKVPT